MCHDVMDTASAPLKDTALIDFKSDTKGSTNYQRFFNIPQAIMEMAEFEVRRNA
jgi:hypothetical protein